MVNNFEDDSRVLDGGGVMVLRTRSVGGGSIFDGRGGNDGGTDGSSEG
jgi:hypothetical protein